MLTPQSSWSLHSIIFDWTSLKSKMFLFKKMLSNISSAGLYHLDPGSIRLTSHKHPGVSNHRQFDCLFNLLANKKENTMLRIAGPWWGKSTGDRWIPLTKCQQCGKCFHVMTSSCRAGLTIASSLPHWWRQSVTQCMLPSLLPVVCHA